MSGHHVARVRTPWIWRAGHGSHDGNSPFVPCSQTWSKRHEIFLRSASEANLIMLSLWKRIVHGANNEHSGIGTYQSRQKRAARRLCDVCQSIHSVGRISVALAPGVARYNAMRLRYGRSLGKVCQPGKRKQGLPNARLRSKMTGSRGRGSPLDLFVIRALPVNMMPLQELGLSR